MIRSFVLAALILTGTTNLASQANVLGEDCKTLDKDTGFFSGLLKLNNDAYEKCLEKKRGELNAEKATEDYLRKRAEQARKNKEVSEQRRQEAEQRLASLQTEVDGIRGRILNLKNSASSSEDFIVIEKDISSLEGQLDGMRKCGTINEDIDALSTQIDDLHSLMKAAGGS